MKAITKIFFVVALVIFTVGCTTNNLSVKKSEEKLNLLADADISSSLKNYEEKNMDIGFPVKNETVESMLKKLSDKYKIVYMLENGNLYLKDSIYKVYTVDDLKNYIKETTNYTLIIENPSYKRNQIVKVKLEPKAGHVANYTLQGTTTLFKALGNLMDSNINITFSQKVKDKDISLSIKTGNVGEYIKKVCSTADVWCEYDGKNVRVNEKKPFYITSAIRGKVTFALGGEEGGSGGGGGEDGDNGESVASKASQSVTYKIENMEFKELVAQLQDQFDVEMYPSADGFLMFYGTPHQYDLITSYFNEVKAKQEPIAIKLQLLRVDLKNQFQFGVDWQNLGSTTIDGYKIFASTLTGASSVLDGLQMGISKAGVDKGLISALNTYGNVHMIDNFYNQSMTGKIIPFSNYKLVRYFTTGTNTTETNTETTVEIQEDEVGFKGSLVVTKGDGGYLVDGIIELSTVVDYVTLQLDQGEIKAPEIAGKNIRVNTKINELGDSIVIGGFRSKGIENNDKSVPLLGDIAGIEWLFSGKDNISQNSEFVVVLTLNKPRSGKIRVKQEPVDVGKNYTDKTIPYIK